MKKILLLMLVNISFLGVSFAGGLYNLHSVSYTYGCNGKDNTSDHCGYGEINLKNKRGGASSVASYTCGKIDNTSPTVSITGIKPERSWVNIDKYNPIKNINIVVRDAGAGVRYIKLNIGTRTLIWDFGYSHKKSTFTINYSNICAKAGGGSDCYKSLFLEGKNDISVEAYDAVYSFYNGAQDPSNSNKGNAGTQIWVDNSRSTYTVGGSKSFNANGLGIIPDNIDNNWKNKTLTISNSIKDEYGEGTSLNISTKICTGKPSNSIWTAPNGVNKDNGKFTSYNGNPGVGACNWDCKIGYVKDGNKCIKKEKTFSCATYLHDTYNYNLSNVDGKKLYFMLDGGIINKRTGIYTGVYDAKSHSYIPSLKNCKLKGGNLNVYYSAKDANGKPITVSMPANGIILNANPLSVIPDRGQKSCGSLGNLVDFNNGGGGGNGDIKASYIYKLKDTYGGGYYDMKDHNKNSLVNDKNEFELWYEIVDQNNVKHEDKDISKVCGEKTCVANSKKLDASSCKCIENYYPIDQTTNKVGKYSNCTKLSYNQCLKDTNGDGYLDTILTLGTNQIVNMKDIIYSTSKVPECGKICTDGPAKDTNGDGYKDTCAINGKCGSANGGKYKNRPSTGLCSKGTPSSVKDNGVKYTWTCNGKNGGTSSSCYANNSEKILVIYNGARRRSDGIYSRSCDAYKNKVPSGHKYAGKTGNGLYWITAGGSKPFKVYCDMTTDGGGWTLIATIANDGNNYWAYKNVDYFTAGHQYGNLNSALTHDYQSLAWNKLSASILLLKKYSSNDFLQYNNILNHGTMASAFNRIPIGREFLASKIQGTWITQNEPSKRYVHMCLKHYDDDTPLGARWNDGLSVGFVFRSHHNYNSNYDDLMGGINRQLCGDANEEQRIGNIFYRKNFKTALNVFVK